MSKVMGCWPRGRSTSRPWGYPPGFANSWNRLRLNPNHLQPLDVALSLDEEWRWEYLDWALEQRRKEKMMDSYYREQMMEAAGAYWLDIDSPWMTRGTRALMDYVRYQENRLGIRL